LEDDGDVFCENRKEGRLDGAEGGGKPMPERMEDGEGKELEEDGEEKWR